MVRVKMVERVEVEVGEEMEGVIDVGEGEALKMIQLMNQRRMGMSMKMVVVECMIGGCGRERGQWRGRGGRGAVLVITNPPPTTHHRSTKLYY